MREWIVEYRPKCGCTALKEPVDCGQGFTVYTDQESDHLRDLVKDYRTVNENVEQECIQLRAKLERDTNSLATAYNDIAHLEDQTIELRAKLDVAETFIDNAMPDD